MPSIAGRHRSCFPYSPLNKNTQLRAQRLHQPQINLSLSPHPVPAPPAPPPPVAPECLFGLAELHAACLTPPMQPSISPLATTLLATLLLAACSSPTQRAAGPIDLFNGRDLANWRHVLADPAVPRDQVWSVQDGMIRCLGTPLGYLHTPDHYTNFRLLVEYRWAPGTQPGNSGLFSRVHGPTRALPRCAEVQLMHGNAGDVLTLHGMRLHPDQPRYFHVANHEVAGDIDGVKKTANAELAPGEWNRVEVLAEGGSYRVWLNGQLVNEVQGVDIVPGPIGLQSEGGQIDFRRVTLTPLP